MIDKTFEQKQAILEKMCEEINLYTVVEWLGRSNKRLKGRRPSEFFIKNNLSPIIEILDSEIKRLSKKK